jgi:hypothetical protein
LPTPDRATPRSLHAQAIGELQFIRSTMERATTFTAVPGWGGVVIGVTALAATPVAGTPDSTRWLTVWLGEAVLAIAIGVAAMRRKARVKGTSLWTAPARRFALAYLPPMAAGAVLTAVFARIGRIESLPGCWLLLYGVALTTGGSFSVPVVAVMGLVFMALGSAASLGPTGWGPWLMAAGFGGVHIGFGLVIARRFGG